MATKAEEMRHAKTLRKLASEEEAEANALRRGGRVKKMAVGGFTREADGIAQRGKTKAKQVVMKRGGRC